MCYDWRESQTNIHNKFESTHNVAINMVVVVIMYNKSVIKHITFTNKKLSKPKNVFNLKKKIEKCFCGDYLVQMQSNDEIKILRITIIEPFGTSWVRLPNINVLPTDSPSINQGIWTNTKCRRYFD